MNKPRVTVLMPVYNAEKYIKDSIQSVLDQTFTDFEFLVVNDSSQDSTESIVKEIAEKDPRVKLINNKFQKGIVGALNTGIEEAKGEYIARMDHDDFSLPQRFEKQIKFMDEHKEVGICGTWVETFGSKSNIVWKLPIDSQTIKVTMLFYGGLTHPTVMIRRSLLMDNNLRYDQDFIWSEDLDLWTRAAKFTEFANIPEVLFKYRTHTENVGSVHNFKQAENVRRIRLREIMELGIFPTYEESEVHESIGSWNFQDFESFLYAVENWFDKLFSLNLEKKIYSDEALLKFSMNKWLDIYEANKSHYKDSEITTKAVDFKRVLSSDLAFHEYLNESIEALKGKFKSVDIQKILTSPKVSVVMAAYNAQSFISDSIESILNQTFKDFEYIIVNDSSTDETPTAIEKYAKRDPRVKFLNNENTKGISGAANTGLKHARGEYIARMDSDDISLEKRLEKQVKFMDEHQDIGVCGTWVELFGTADGTIWTLETDPNKIKCIMFFYGAISNPAVIIRNSVLKENDIWYKDVDAEDYEMFVRLSKVTKLTNIPKVLLKYRMHKKNFGVMHKTKQDEGADAVRMSQLKDLGIEPSEVEFNLHLNICNWNFSNDKSFLNGAEIWLQKIVQANYLKKIYPEPEFSILINEKWLDIYKKTNYLGTIQMVDYILRKMPFAVSYKLRVKFILRCVKAYLIKFRKRILNKDMD